jgi:RNA recognition motif-containing protein
MGPSAGQSSCLLFDNLPPSLSCTGLSLLCERVGPVVFSKVIRDVLHHSLRCGYVQMQTAEDAHRLSVCFTTPICKASLSL